MIEVALRLADNPRRLQLSTSPAKSLVDSCDALLPEIVTSDDSTVCVKLSCPGDFKAEDVG